MNRSVEQTKARFNVIDLVILLTAIALVVSTILRYQSFTLMPEPKEQIEVEIKILIENMNSTLIDGIVDGEGKTVYLADTDTPLGTLRDSTFSNAKLIVTQEDGSVVTVENRYASDVTCLLSAVGIMSEEGFLLDGTTYLAPGMEISIKTQKVTATALITDIKSPT